MRNQGVPLIQRLHHEADFRDIDRAKKKHLQELQEAKSCSFKPQINQKSARILKNRPAGRDYRPIHERIDSIAKAKATKLARLKTEQMNSSDNTFSPTITAKSKVIAERIDKTGDGLRTTSRAQAARPMSAPKNEFTYHPKLNRKSAEIVKHSRLFSSDSDFLSRQSVFEMRRERNKRELQQLTTPRPGSAKPRTSAEIAQVTERLYNTQPKRGEQPWVGQGGYTFQPEINPTSRAIGRTSTVEELVSDDRTRMRREMARKMADKAFAEAHTFKPERVSKVDSESHYDFKHPERILTQIESDEVDRSVRQQQLKHVVSAEEVIGCTFKPTIRSAPAVTADPIVVRGLGRFLELKDIARRNKEEKQQLEDRAFHANPTAHRDLPYTVPEPFALSTDPGQTERQRRVLEDARAREMAECTFQPNGGRVKQGDILNAIINDFSDDEDDWDDDI
ncbi:hypothetical protein J8273_6378 [Carpediemonas membranifera]|uniref:Uncharacterized protein n=1 Tax=Carpediemonas membranifera TaxID=201153 RepID=A0A8J6E037_9EUKA|nr:hypothetical protein J8273_6378 [Carpediemonas membranifera]|eukprot:KAG9391613.1 hypothetical protein J8273_6378 [Carpediemonas membranifera]